MYVTGLRAGNKHNLGTICVVIRNNGAAEVRVLLQLDWFDGL